MEQSLVSTNTSLLSGRDPNRMTYRFISLGWGVQSFTLAAMAALGVIEPVDAAIFADTTYEKQATYNFAKTYTPWLQEHGMEVVWAFPHDTALIFYAKQGPSTHLPLHGYDPKGRKAMLKRQCTQQWKIRTTRRTIRREYYPFKGNYFRHYDQPVQMLLGITTDEWTRVSDSQSKWIVNAYPLLDMNMSRQDCIAWLTEQGLPVPPKSACVHCPYQKNRDWNAMAYENGEDWKRAQEIDEQIRRYKPGGFVHRNMIPLSAVEETASMMRGLKQRNLLDGIENHDDDDDLETCDSGYCFM